MVASLALLSADTAWSEASKQSTVKKATPQKAKAKAATQSKRPKARTAAPKPSTSTPAAVQATAVAAPVQAAMPPAAQPVSPGIQAQASGNPYLPVPQPTTWNAQATNTTAPVNPYSARPQVLTAEAPTPWSVLPTQIPRYSPPTWVNPFQGFQFPFPAAPTPFPAPLAAVQPASPAPQAATNPYLAYRLPILPPTPWTPPAVQIPQFPPPAWSQPYAPPAAVAAATVVPPVAAQPAATLPPWWNNPYLAHLRPAHAAQAARQPEAVKPPVWPTYSAPAQVVPPQFAEVVKSPVAQAPLPPVSVPASPLPQATPVQSAQAPQPEPETAVSTSVGGMLEKLKYAIFPNTPPSGQAILPTIKTVYPTGEKPLKVLTFKCPTELVGVTPPPTAALHEAVNLAFDGINKTNLLPFNMQQVCQ
ncbi:MAG: hypothetical protein FD187_1682 [bacterium]|nr:MAG: hypothetical protein FD142_2048 [bacterium]KAF0148887.1 MAG: hypothetical protein FD187_1682 [bacterium]KAF0168288.1 MAG: hypothetical protein FD158_1519 [bacterium]TXT20317.1 MAG: hypothetical protein FD132_1360 [bacterium]